jgi:gliding motility-associated-like protein
MPTLDTLYFENFEGIHNWNLATSTGTNGTEPNVWEVNDSEGGVAPTGCGVSNNGDNTLHITCTSLLCGTLITGALYNATEESNTRAESPVFSTVGYNNIAFTFDYIANGDGLNDNASLLYNDGSGWQVLDPSLKSTICVGGQGEWTAYSVTLPASCDNNPTVQIAFNWTNNADNIGTDPSIAVNNTLLTSTSAGGTVQICTVVNDTSIIEPFTLAVSVDTVGNVVCDGNSNGFINISVSGGTAPLTYIWSNGDTTQDITNLIDTTYSVTITDANACITVGGAVVSTLGFIEAVVDSAMNVIGCNGDSTGAIYLTATGDTSTTGCASSVVALNEIMYRPVLRNGQDPNTGEYIELIGPAGTDISCYVLADGDWTITIPQGTTIPSDGFFTIGNDNVWGAGTFDLDAENCNCFTEGATGSGSGLLILTDGGEYVALYDGSGTFLEGVIYGSPTAGNTPNGNVELTVGTAGCPTSVTMPAVAAFETAPAGFSPGTSLIRSPDGSGAWIPQVGGSLNTCNSFGSGSTGNGSVTYLWNNGDTTQDISNLPAGTYTVTATNTYGCTATTSYTVTEPAVLTATAQTTNVACAGGSTGLIDLTVTGGTMPYSFNWSNGATTEDISMLTSGSYCVTVTDSSGCMAIVCDTVEEPFFTIPVDTFYLCAGDSVQIQVNTNISNLSWTPSATLSNDTISNPFASPISTTTYVVSVLGAACTTMDSITVIVGSVAVNLTGVNPLCNGDTTGSITTTTTGSNYTYLWNTGDTTTNLINQGAGTYTLMVSSGACQDTFSVTLTEPTAIALSLSSSINPACNGDSTGSIDISNSGGTLPYTYSWSNTATTQNLSNIPAGGYGLTLTDSNGCTAPLAVVLTEPSAINISYSTTGVSCGGSNDGSASITPTGGTPTYTYLWDVTANNQTTATATNLGTNTYSVTVTDSEGCMADANGIFVNPGVPVDSNDVPLVVVTGMLNCDLTPIGALEINTANNYSYLWSNGATSVSVTGLPAGTYSVTVTNGLGCTYVQTADINSPFVPTINPFIVNVGLTTTTVTAGTIVNINGGNDQSFQGVTYNWTNPSTDVTITTPTAHATTAMSSTAGSYVLTLTATANDSTACQDTASVILNIESIYTGMPDAFTPNGDGINDVYRPVGLSAEDVLTFRVYNRWGQEVYNGDDLENAGWDGRFQGVEQPTETYLFLLEYKLGVNSEAKVQKGEFRLVR